MRSKLMLLLPTLLIGCAASTQPSIVINDYQADADKPKPQSTPEERAKWPLPPDLVHFGTGSCVLYKVVKEEVLDAKTGKLVPKLFVWVVQPVASYDDKRDQWRYERKNGDPNFIGERASGHDAWDLCVEWMDFVKLAADKERAAHGH